MNSSVLLTRPLIPAAVLLVLSLTLAGCNTLRAITEPSLGSASSQGPVVPESGRKPSPATAPSPEPISRTVRAFEKQRLPPTALEFELTYNNIDPVPEVAGPVAATAFITRNTAPISLVTDDTLDLWETLVEQMQLTGAGSPGHNRPTGQNRETRWLRANEAHLTEVLGRARRYLPHILEAVTARGMPGEIALMPAIESGFQTDVRSPHGADGLWQFMPATARSYGLKTNDWYDGRRDTIAATKAALDYLQALNVQFDGNWLVSISAYNCGEGTMRRVLRRAKLHAKDADLASLLPHLPKETRRYVPRLLAFAELVRDRSASGGALPPSDATAKFVTVEIGGQIELAVAAQMIGVETSALRALNPAFRRWATDPDGPHRLLVLPEHAQPMRQALASTTTLGRIRWRRHQVRPGESLSLLARRYGVRVKDLARANGLSSSQIRAGDELRVPTHRAQQPDARSRVVSGALYRVRSGDSLWRIARRHKTTVQRLLRLNRLTRSSVLRPGQTLRVA